MHVLFDFHVIIPFKIKIIEKQDCVWLSYYFNFERNYDVLTLQRLGEGVQ